MLTQSKVGNAAFYHSFLTLADAAFETPYLIERLKIVQLILCVRQMTWRFERNGRLFTCPEAAARLARKYRAVAERISTAEQFIEFIATGSAMSGRPYYFLSETGTRIAVGDFLLQELEVLELNLKNISLNRAKEAS